MGAWNDPDDDLYYTEPAETTDDYDEAAREGLIRDQKAIWDNAAFVVDPQTGKRRYLDQATIPRSDIAQQGIANSTGFTLSKKRSR